MSFAIPLNRKNIHMAAALAEVPVEELYKRMVDSQMEYKKEQEKEHSCQILGKDRAWYDATMQKIAEIRASLPEDLDHKEATIRKYGWIAKEVQCRLSLPFETEHSPWSEASVIETILNQPNLYDKCMRFD